MQIKTSIICFCLFFSTVSAFAGGNFSVGRDEGGVYFETDEGQSWYIGKPDLPYFTVGQKGSYTLHTDSGGTYLLTDQRRKFYVGKGVDAPTPPLPPAFSDTPPPPPSAKKKEMNVLIHGNQVLVPVTLHNAFRKEEVLLLLDTGASIVILHKDIADRLKLKPIRTEQIVVAGGEKLPMTLVTLPKIAAGPLLKKNMVAGVIDHQGPAVPYQGLLGMNFLKGMNYTVDFEKQTIRWAQ